MVITSPQLDSYGGEIGWRDGVPRRGYVPVLTPQTFGVVNRGEEARDIACLAALAPHLSSLARQAEIAGWDPTEFLVGILAWAAERASSNA